MDEVQEAFSVSVNTMETNLDILRSLLEQSATIQKVYLRLADGIATRMETLASIDSLQPELVIQLKEIRIKAILITTI